MENILKESLQNTMTYKEYRDLVEKLVKEESTTGSDQTREHIEFTKLNNRRMHRWDKTLKIPDSIKEKVSIVEKRVHWLVITESWCGDAAHLIPVFNKLAELSPNIDLKLVMRDENNDLMNLFLTNGNRSIPKLIVIDKKSEEVLEIYGSRPSTLTEVVMEHKEKHGKLSAEFKEEIQRWYNKDKGQTAFEDLSKLLNKSLV